MVGKTLGHYEILEPLGKGGMGEVYRARDTKLDRDVAIKVLPEDLADDPDRLARLRREAKLLAALNHPNIATVHALEGEEGASFLVLELVTGESLEQKLARGPLPVEKALDICKQIAEALEAAHGAGIIHRDLKPANVLVTPDGRAKVLDFGIAKSMQVDAEVAATAQATNLTVAGTLVGTPSYMSPEQVRGGVIDKRVDIWAFGCLLFETLTGKSAFAKETLADTLAAIVDQDPDWDTLPNEISPQVRRLIERCLRKDPQRRLHDIADARIEIEDSMDAPPETAVAAVRPPPSAWTRTLPWAVAIVAASLAVILGYQAMTLPPPVPIHAVALPPDVVLTAGNAATSFGVSPDGSTLLYWARSGEAWQLHSKLMAATGSTVVGDQTIIAMEQGLYFSPDGRKIAFANEESLWWMPIDGRSPVEICKLPEVLRGAAWGPDNTIVLSAGVYSGLSQVPADGGRLQVLTTPNPDLGEVAHRWPHFIGDKNAVVFNVAYNGSHDDDAFGVYSFETGETRILPTIRGTYPRYVHSGHLLYARAGSLFAVPFDADRLEITGSAAPVLDDVAVNSIGMGSAHYVVSATGTLVYVPQHLRQFQVVLVDRSGAIEVVDQIPPGAYVDAQLSPNGQFIAVTDAHRVIHVLDRERGSFRALDSSPNLEWGAVFLPDNETLVFSSTFGRGGFNLARKPAAEAGAAEQLLDSIFWQWPTSVSPDGQIILFDELRRETTYDIYALEINGDRAPVALVDRAAQEMGAVFSPNGRFFAYQSNETGANEIYVRSFSLERGIGLQISTDGGIHPVWNPAGGDLFYISGSRLMTVPVDTENEFRAGTPRVVWEPDETSWSIADTLFDFDFDVTPDGQRFLFRRPTGEVPPIYLNVVSNWFEELKRLVPTGGSQ